MKAEGRTMGRCRRVQSNRSRRILCLVFEQVGCGEGGGDYGVGENSCREACKNSVALADLT